MSELDLPSSGNHIDVHVNIRDYSLFFIRTLFTTTHKHEQLTVDSNSHGESLSYQFLLKILVFHL